MYYNVRVQFTEEVPTGKNGIKLKKKSEAISTNSGEICVFVCAMSPQWIM